MKAAHKKARRQEKIAFAILRLAGGLALAALAFILGYVMFRGFYTLSQEESRFLPQGETVFFAENARERFMLFAGAKTNIKTLTAAQLDNIMHNRQQTYTDASGQNRALGFYRAADLIEAERRLRNNPYALVLADASGQTPNKNLAKRSVAVQSLQIAVAPEVLAAYNNISLGILNKTQLEAVLQGQVDNWQQAGGPDLPAALVQADSARALAQEMMRQPGSYAIMRYWDVKRFNLQTLSFMRPYRGRNLTLSFLLQPPRRAGAAGGFSTIIGNTFFMISLTLALAVPLGVGCAVYTTQYAKNKYFLKLLRAAVDTLAGIPSIIFGLFGLILFVQTLKLGIGLLSGSLTVSIMLLPTIMRNSEEALKNVPSSYNEGSMALGANKWQTIWRVMLPSAKNGILTGVLLAVGRALGETAALTFTMGFDYRLVSSLTDSARTLSTHLYMLVKEGISMERAFAAAAVLTIIVLGVNLLAERLLNKREAR